MSEILDRYRYQEAQRIKEKQQGRPGIAQRFQQAEEGVLGKPDDSFGTLLKGIFSIVWPEATLGSIGAEKLAGLVPGKHPTFDTVSDFVGGIVGALAGDPESLSIIGDKLLEEPAKTEAKAEAEKEIGTQFTQSQLNEAKEESTKKAYNLTQRNLNASGKKEVDQKVTAMQQVLKFENSLHSAQVKAMLMNPRIATQKLLTDIVNLPVQAAFKGLGVGQEQGIAAGVKTTLSALQAYRMTFKDAMRYAYSTWKSGDPEFLKSLGMDNPSLTYANESENSWLNSEHAAGLRFIRNVYGAGTKMIMSADQFAKALAYSGEIRMGAFYDGLNQAEQRGLVGAAKYHFADIWQEQLFNQTPDWLHEQATQGMMKSTFTDQSRLMKWIEEGRHIPGIRIAVPFFRTPMNLLKTGLEISPVNLSWLWKGDLDQTTSLGKWMVGSAMFYELAEQTARGNITGDGPQGAGREQWSGYKHPRSIQVNGNWYSYKNLGPFAEIVALAADSTEMYHGSQNPDQVQRLIDTVGGVFQQQVEHAPFWEEMFNMTHVIDSWKTGKLDKTGSEFLTRIATSFEPSPIRMEAQVEDPVVHDAQTMKQELAESVPGWGKYVGLPTSFSVPAKQDMFGHDMHPAGAYDASGNVSKLHYLANQINPFPSYPDTPPDPVDQEIWKLGWQPHKWPQAFWSNPEPGTKDVPEASVPLTANQQKELADYAGHEYAPGGLNMHDRMLRMINSPIYNRLDLVSKKQQLEGIYNGYMQAGMGYIARKYPELEQQYIQKQKETFALGQGTNP